MPEHNDWEIIDGSAVPTKKLPYQHFRGQGLGFQLRLNRHSPYPLRAVPKSPRENTAVVKPQSKPNVRLRLGPAPEYRYPPHTQGLMVQT